MKITMMTMKMEMLQRIYLLKIVGLMGPKEESLEGKMTKSKKGSQQRKWNPPKNKIQN